MARWSWSDFFRHAGDHQSAPVGSSDLISSPMIGLDLDELIAMRGRRPSVSHRRKINGFRFGDLSSKRRGIGLELDNIGPYQWGDDIRHMDWFATARTGRPQVKQFRFDVQQTVMAALDLRPHMAFGSNHYPMLKTACLAAAKLAWATSYDHQPLGLLLIGADQPILVPPKRGRRARLQHLSQIVSGYEQAIARTDRASPSLADGLDPLASAMAGDVEAVIISDFSRPGDGFDQTLREISAKGSMSAIVVEDRLMQQAPPSGVYPLRTDHDRALTTVAIRAGDENVYSDHADDHRRRLASDLVSLGMWQVLFADPVSINDGYFR